MTTRLLSLPSDEASDVEESCWIWGGTLGRRRGGGRKASLLLAVSLTASALAAHLFCTFIKLMLPRLLVFLTQVSLWVGLEAESEVDEPGVATSPSSISVSAVRDGPAGEGAAPGVALPPVLEARAPRRSSPYELPPRPRPRPLPRAV